MSALPSLLHAHVVRKFPIISKKDGAYAPFFHMENLDASRLKQKLDFLENFVYTIYRKIEKDYKKKLDKI